MSRNPNSDPSPDDVAAKKKIAAFDQLESAILLWFNEADSIWILVMASNSEDSFHALGKEFGKPSFYQAWLQKMPRSFQERTRSVQDFAKHRPKDLRGQTDAALMSASVLMISAVERCQETYGEYALTPLMRLFRARFFLEYPELAPKDHQEFFEATAIYRLAGDSRRAFFGRCQTLLAGLVEGWR